MPKIFLTGSGTTKGYVTGSGIISNPVRYKIRRHDELTGQYPAILRMNKQGYSGNNTFTFDDNETIIFEEVIKDDFQISDKITLFKNVDAKIWSTPIFTKIRKDSIRSNLKKSVGLVVFNGKERYLKLNKKIRNPTVTFDLYSGPYSGKNLTLQLDDKSNNFKVQISEDGSTSWKDIEITVNSVSDSSVIESGAIKGFNLARDNKVRVKLDIINFDKLTGKEYYFQFAQETYNIPTVPNFAIDNVKIISRNKSVKYPLLTSDGEKQFTRYIDSLAATPNALEGPVVTGSAHSSVVGVFDSKYRSQELPIFKDEVHHKNDDFFSTGIDANIYPGFSGQLKNKTVIEVDLTPSTEIKLGMINKVTASYNTAYLDESGIGQNLMAYWNPTNSTWEKVGQPLCMNTNSTKTFDSMKNYLSESCLGFGSTITSICKSGSVDGKNYSVEKKYARELLENTNNKTTAFSFPHGAQYFATASQWVKAKDLGITKPFLLEKMTLDFDAVFNLPSSGSFLTQSFAGYALRVGVETPTAMGFAYSKIALYTPTFFMMRQYKDNFSKDINLGHIADTSTTGTLSRKLTIPTYQRLTSGSNSLTFVDKSRDLITYGQYGLFATASNMPNSVGFVYNISQDGEPTSLESLNDAGLKFDGNQFVTYDMVTGLQLSQSFSMNIPVRASHRIDSPISSIMFAESTLTSDIGMLGFKNESSVTRDDLSVTRNLFNGRGGYLSEKTEEVARGDFFKNSSPITVDVPSSDRDDTTAYLIMPEDELILGWQYPISDYFMYVQPGTDSLDEHMHYMKLIGKSKLKLFGSQILNGKEFHEGLNQNLTSNAIHEMIGSEPVVDKYEIANRTSLTGSFHTQYSYSTVSALSPSIVYGRNIFDGFIKQNYIKPAAIIGTVTFDIVDRALNESLHSSSEYYKTGILYKNSFNFVLQDLTKVPIDNTKNVGYFYDDSSYGTGQGTLTFLTTDVVSPDSTFFPQKESYMFSNNHFGYFADMIQQGKDTAFETTVVGKNNKVDNTYNTSPVSVMFVSGSYSDKTLEFKKFHLLAVADIEGTSYDQYQSSNLSLHATSSTPFIDDNTARNRSFVSDSITIE